MQIEEPDIIQLTDLQHVRMRTSLYLGSTVSTASKFPIFKAGKFVVEEIEYVPALLTAFRELLDNALDELSFVGGGSIDITYNENDLTFSVFDSGRGLPIEYDENLGGLKGIVALTALRTGRNFGDRGELAGTNGVGAAAVNFCSEAFEIEVWRDKQHLIQKFNVIDDELVHQPEIVEKAKKSEHGTYIFAKLDRKIFKTGTLPIAIVESLVRMIAITQPKIKFKLNNEPVETKHNVSKELFDGKAIEVKLNVDDQQFDYYVVSTKDQPAIELGLVNNIPAVNGGSHLHAFKHFFAKGSVAALEKYSKKKKLWPRWQDIVEDCIIFGVTKMRAPDFDAQSKTRLINNLWPVLEPALNEIDWGKAIWQQPDFVEAIYARLAARSSANDRKFIERKSKELRKRKLAKLVDATSNNRTECSLAIFEGDSAKGTYMAVRNTKTQAAMPLRGKIQNTWNKQPKDAFGSSTIEDICTAIGLTPGKSVDPGQLRYGRIEVYTDQDLDGFHISTALVALFYKFWPELFDGDWLQKHNRGEPFIVLVLTPIIGLIHKKTKEMHYIYNEHTPQSEWPAGYEFFSRYKGLGALSVDDFKAHVNNNACKVAVTDDGELYEILDRHFSWARADDRKLQLQ